MLQLTRAIGLPHALAIVAALMGLVFPSIAHPQTYQALEVRASPQIAAQVGGFLLDDLNNDLVGVGVAFDNRAFRNVAFYWTPLEGVRLMPFVADPQSLVINNRGEIAGIRRVAGDPNRLAAFQFTGPDGIGFRELELPRSAEQSKAERLTDSGIFLFHILLQTGRFAYFAIYRSRLIPLPGLAVAAVLEDGTTAGVGDDAMPFIRRADGTGYRPAVPVRRAGHRGRAHQQQRGCPRRDAQLEREFLPERVSVPRGAVRGRHATGGRGHVFHLSDCHHRYRCHCREWSVVP